MDTHSSSKTDSAGGFWPVANIVLGSFFALFAFYWGALLVGGGISNSWKLRASAEPETAQGAVAPAAAPAAAVTTPPVTTFAGPPAEITLKPAGPSGMDYDTKTFTVKSGQKVRFTFNNTHPLPLPHNWVLGKPGTKDKLFAAAMAAMTDPKALEKGYIPETPDVLQHTTLVQPGKSETIEFIAPAVGEYPYMCTFPGHGILMNGVMKVE